jgi:hypothetical protein
MSFWSPTLNKINTALAELYPDQEDSVRVVVSAGLDSGRINFSNKAINNWFSILREAKNEGKIPDLLKFAIEDSKNQELAAAYQEYLNTSPLLGGGAPLLPVFLMAFWGWVKKHPGLIIGTLATIVFVVIAAVVFYLFFWKTSISGSISCADSSPQPGKHLDSVTVFIPDTNFQAETNEEGRFVINNVPRYKTVTNLYVRRGPESYNILIKDFPDADYKVFRCPIDTPVTYPIQADWWKETPLSDSILDNCHAGGEISQVKLYTLIPFPSITKKDPGNRLYINISCVGAEKIMDADLSFPLIKPDDYYQEETLPNYQPDKVRQWWVSMPKNQIDVKFQVCLGASQAQQLSSSMLDGYYYFK